MEVDLKNVKVTAFESAVLKVLQRLFQRVYEFKTDFIIILRHNLPFRRAVSMMESRSARALVSTNQGCCC